VWVLHADFTVCLVMAGIVGSIYLATWPKKLNSADGMIKRVGDVLLASANLVFFVRAIYRSLARSRSRSLCSWGGSIMIIGVTHGYSEYDVDPQRINSISYVLLFGHGVGPCVLETCR